MLVLEVGPGRVFLKLRELTGIEHDDSDKIVSWNDYSPLYCVACTSLYVAALLLLAPESVHKILAASAVSSLIEARYGTS